MSVPRKAKASSKKEKLDANNFIINISFHIINSHIF